MTRRLTQATLFLLSLTGAAIPHQVIAGQQRPASDRFDVESNGTVKGVQGTPIDAPPPSRPLPQIVAPARSPYSVYYDFLYSTRVPYETRHALAPRYDEYFRTLQEIDAYKHAELMEVASGLLPGAVKSRVRGGTPKDPRVTIEPDPITETPPSYGSGERLARLARQREEIQRLERDHGITPADSPIDRQSDPVPLDQDTLDRWMREAAVAAARNVALETPGSAATRIANMDRARTESERRRREIEDKQRQVRELQATLESSTARRDESEQRYQQAAGDAASSRVPPDMLRTAVPANWIQCQCPARHPNAGLFIDGHRWHTPTLSCSTVH
jgi:hypothetical protein